MKAVTLHLLPFDLSRGAQVYAQALCDALDRPDEPHAVVTLYRAEPAVLRPRWSLDAPMGVLRSTGWDARVGRRLSGLVRRVRPRALIAHGSEPLKYAALLPYGPPVVAFRIGVSSLSGSSARGRFFAWQLSRAAAVVGVSQDVLTESAERFGVPGERLVYIPNGRDAGVYHPPPQAPVGRPRLLFVGHWDENKRPEWVIELSERLRSRGVDHETVMVGEGPRLEALAPRARAAGIQVLGRRNDVPDLLRSAHVVVLTSVMEGMPGVLVEAGLTGVPVVTTDVPGARAVVEDGVTGHVVGTHDLDTLVDRVQQLLLDPAVRRAMGEAAVARCTERFSLSAGVTSWRAVIDGATAA